MIDAKLWHQAKAKTGTRTARKCNTKTVKNQSAQKRIRATYDEMVVKARDIAAKAASKAS